MAARQKLNSWYGWLAFVCAAVAGGMTGSLLVFVLTFALILALCVWNGDIRA